MDGIKLILKERTRSTLIFSLVLLVGIAPTVMVTAFAADQKPTAAQPRSIERTALHQFQDALTSLVNGALPSVVSITSKKTVETDDPSSGFNDFFKGFPLPMPQPEQPDAPKQKHEEQSSGSGVIVRADGYILTNNHVVGGADKVTVKLKDGREFDGKVLSDARSDLAVVKINAKNLPSAKLTDSNDVKVGEWAVAIGSPFGLDQTVTMGIISAIGRQAAAPDGAGFYPNLIQTDASINPGNSGGPLINIDGEVIGINTLIRSSMGGGNIGIGFAIPSNTAKFVLDQLIANGKVTRGYLGIKPSNLTPKLQERLSIKAGVWVESVEVGSPADKAGIEVEDVIVEFNSKPVTDEIQFRELVASTTPGKPISMVVFRDKVKKTLNVTPTEPPTAEASEAPKEVQGKLGFNVANITSDLIDKYKLDAGTKGIVITSVSPDSAAAQVGIEAGQLVVRANDQPVKTAAEFNAATKNLKSGDELRLVLKSKQRQAFVTYTLD